MSSKSPNPQNPSYWAGLGPSAGLAGPILAPTPDPHTPGPIRPKLQQAQQATTGFLYFVYYNFNLVKYYIIYPNYLWMFGKS